MATVMDLSIYIVLLPPEYTRDGFYILANYINLVQLETYSQLGNGIGYGGLSTLYNNWLGYIHWGIATLDDAISYNKRNTNNIVIQQYIDINMNTREGGFYSYTILNVVSYHSWANATLDDAIDLASNIVSTREFCVHAACFYGGTESGINAVHANNWLGNAGLTNATLDDAIYLNTDSIIISQLEGYNIINYGGIDRGGINSSFNHWLGSYGWTHATIYGVNYKFYRINSDI